MALAMIRHFIHHPVQHTLIFNLNNAEELGLFGAAAFMGAPPNSTMETGSGHPWKKYIRAFINLGKTKYKEARISNLEPQYGAY